MAEDRLVPRHLDKPPCEKCGGKGYTTEQRKNGDSVTTTCDACIPPRSSNK